MSLCKRIRPVLTRACSVLVLCLEAQDARNAAVADCKGRKLRPALRAVCMSMMQWQNGCMHAIRDLSCCPATKSKGKPALPYPRIHGEASFQPSEMHCDAVVVCCGVASQCTYWTGNLHGYASSAHIWTPCSKRHTPAQQATSGLGMICDHPPSRISKNQTPDLLATSIFFYRAC